MKQFYVYIYSDPSRNFEPIYVGKGYGLRAYEHLSRGDNHPLINRLKKMKSNGIEPLIEKIEVSNEEFAFMLECGLIKQFGRKKLKNGTLLNLTDGGEGVSGLVISEESRQKMSKAKIGHVPWNKGKKGIYSETTLRKMSESRMGRLPGNAGQLVGKTWKINPNTGKRQWIGI